MEFMNIEVAFTLTQNNFTNSVKHYGGHSIMYASVLDRNKGKTSVNISIIRSLNYINFIIVTDQSKTICLFAN